MKLKLIHGDCLEEMKRLPDNSVDLFICDLPYGCLSADARVVKHDNGSEKVAFSSCAWDKKIDLDAFWEQVERLMKDDHTPIIHFCNLRFGMELYNSKPSWFRYDLVWNKVRAVGFLNANRMPMRTHENIFVFSKKGSYYNRIDIEGDFPDTNHGGSTRTNVYSVIPGQRTSNEGRRCVGSIVEVPGKVAKGKHPTQKPDDIYKWLIERYSKPGDTILDPTAGSFASCFTAIELGRQAIGIEKDDKFYAKALSLVKE